MISSMRDFVRPDWKTMNGRNDNKTPDLFSGIGGGSVNQPSELTAARTSRRPVLPKNLPEAIRYLNDRDLVRLLYAAIDEVKRRRGLSFALQDLAKRHGSAESSSKHPKPTSRSSRQRQVGIATASLTRGQVNAVRAAFKAGITPSRIARQFGLSQSDVRKALSSDEPER